MPPGLLLLISPAADGDKNPTCGAVGSRDGPRSTACPGGSRQQLADQRLFSAGEWRLILITLPHGRPIYATNTFTAQRTAFPKGSFFLCLPSISTISLFSGRAPLQTPPFVPHRSTGARTDRCTPLPSNSPCCGTSCRWMDTRVAVPRNRRT